MKMKTYAGGVTLALIGLLGWVALSGAFQTASVHAQTITTYTNLSVQGAWGYSFAGVVNGDTQTVGYGVLTADGVGGITGTDCTQGPATGGFRCRTFVGLYTVTSDGTGTMQMDFTDPIDDSALTRFGKFSFVVIDGSRQMRSIRTESGLSISADFHRQ